MQYKNEKYLTWMTEHFLQEHFLTKFYCANQQEDKTLYNLLSIHYNKNTKKNASF